MWSCHTALKLTVVSWCFEALCSTDHATDIGCTGVEVHIGAQSLLTALAVHQWYVEEAVGHASGQLKHARYATLEYTTDAIRIKA